MSNFKTMLAGKVEDPSTIRYPVLASPKLDGIRFHVIDGVVVSRNLLPFRNAKLQKKFGKKKYSGLDGEIMCGDPTDPKAFRRAAVANSLDGDIKEVVFHVFDDFSNPTLRFDTRLRSARQVVGESPHSGLRMVPHVEIKTADDLLQFESECLAAGYEGVMIRDPKGPYKYGRSTAREGYLLKLKQFHDSEAVILDAEEKMHNANEKTLLRAGKAVRNTRKEGKVPMGVLGSVTVRDLHTGVEFSVGSGFVDSERQALWADHQSGRLAGRIIRYQYFPTGSKDKPRFPTFQGFRDEGDI